MLRMEKVIFVLKPCYQFGRECMLIYGNQNPILARRLMVLENIESGSLAQDFRDEKSSLRSSSPS